MSYATKCDVVCHRVPHHDHRGTSLPMSHPLSGMSLPMSYPLSGTSPPARTSLPPQGMSASNNATALGAHRYIEATLELEDEHGFSRPYSTR